MEEWILLLTQVLLYNQAGLELSMLLPQPPECWSLQADAPMLGGHVLGFGLTYMILFKAACVGAGMWFSSRVSTSIPKLPSCIVSTVKYKPIHTNIGRPGSPL